MRRLPQADLDTGNPPGNQKTSIGKKFRLAAALAVYHDKLMCSFDEQRELLDYMTGQRVYLWDIPVAIKLCRKSIDQQYPWMKKYKLDPNGKPDAYPKFIRLIAKDFGSDQLGIQPLKRGAFKARSGLETI